MTSDPIGLVGGVNLFGYVGQNPLIYVDPTGLDKEGDYSAFGSFDLGAMILGLFKGIYDHETKACDDNDKTLTPKEAKSLITITLGLHPQLIPDAGLEVLGGPTTGDVAEIAVENTIRASNRTDAYLESIGE